MHFFVPNGAGGLTAPFHLTIGLGPSSVLTYTLHRDCLHNANDPGMHWQIEGGKVLENGKHVANYSSVKRVSCGTTEQNSCGLRSSSSVGSRPRTSPCLVPMTSIAEARSGV